MTTIPTSLLTTPASQSHESSNPTLSLHDIRSISWKPVSNSPVVLDTCDGFYDFQSNANALYPTALQPPLNGLGIRFPKKLDALKIETYSEKELVAPDNKSIDDHCQGHCNSFLSLLSKTLQDNLAAVDINLSAEIDRVLESACERDLDNSPTFPFPVRGSNHSPFWSASSSLSSLKAQNSSEGISELAFSTSHSSLAGTASSESIDNGLNSSRDGSPVGPFADINMYHVSYMSLKPEAGVDPAQLTLPLSDLSDASDSNTSFINLPGPSPPPLDYSSDETTEKLVISNLKLSNSVSKEGLTAEGTILVNYMPKDQREPDHHRSTATEAFAVHRRSSNFAQDLKAHGKNSSSVTYCVPSVRNPRSPPPNHEAQAPIIKIESPFIYQLPEIRVAARSPLTDLGNQPEFAFQNRRTEKFIAVPKIDRPSTPILNAHHGIDLANLLAKAKRYRERYPGYEIDKKWLLAFAGKLSPEGELLDDFRCYVNGCAQRNKRRDHIATHVGSHVDQRSFCCTVW